MTFLLLKLKSIEKWALPGVFVEKQEAINKAAVGIQIKESDLKTILSIILLLGKAERNQSIPIKPPQKFSSQRTNLYFCNIRKLPA